MGAVMTTQTVAQRLSAYEWLGCSRVLDDAQVFAIARLLYALRLALEELKAYYSALKPPRLTDGFMNPRFCPSIDSYQVNPTTPMVQFRYVRPLESGSSCVTFLAKLNDASQREVVVKFVRRYGREAHEWMAAKTPRWAPELIYHGRLGDGYGDLALVVMEYVVGETFHDYYSGRVDKDIKEVLKRRLDAFNEAGFLFGDLRKPNIMLEGSIEAEAAVRFIDFDWACQTGAGARYPFHTFPASRSKAVSDDDRRHPREYDLIIKEHQDQMLVDL